MYIDNKMFYIDLCHDEFDACALNTNNTNTNRGVMGFSRRTNLRIYHINKFT